MARSAGRRPSPAAAYWSARRPVWCTASGSDSGARCRFCGPLNLASLGILEVLVRPIKLPVFPTGDDMTVAEQEKTGLGNYFVANYPPFSFWQREHLPEADRVMHAS